MYGNQANSMNAPETTGQLIKFIIKKIPERLVKALPVTLLAGLLTWLLHTYLLVVTNEGFSADTWLGKNFLNTTGNGASSAILWTLIGSMLPMMVSFIVQGGNPFKSMAAMVKMPGMIIRKNKATHNAVLPVILFSCGITLLVDKVLSGVASFVAGGIIMGSVVAFITGNGGIFVQIFRLIFSDVQAFVLKKQKSRLDGDSIYLILGSSGIALLIFGLLESTNIFNFVFGKIGAAIPALASVTNFLAVAFAFILGSVWWILILLGIVLLIKNKTVPKTLVVIAAAGLTAFAANRLMGVGILADDGGWVEAGGTFAAWIASEGAVTAVLRGLPPAIGAMVGSFMYSLLGNMFKGIGPWNPGGSVYPKTPVNPNPVEYYQQSDRMVQSVKPVTPVTMGTTVLKPQITEEEKLRREEEAEQERKKAEEARLLELKRQRDIREQALAEKKKLEEQHERWLAEQERLCKKYDTTPDKLMDVLRANNAANQDISRRLADTARNWDIAYKAAVVTLAGCDAAIDGLATVTPGGKWIRGTYKVVQGVAVGGVEASLDGKSIQDGMVGGLIKGGTNAASDFVDNKAAKFVMTAASETVAGGVTGGVDGAIDGAKNGIYNATVGAITDKVGGKGYGNEVSTVSLSGGRTALSITTTSGEVVTKTVSNNVANTFIKNKIANQVVQSEVKAAGAVVSELGVKPVLQDYRILPK